VRFLEAAARSGDVKAHVNLGRAYQHGIGVARDEGMAVSHFKKAHTGIPTLIRRCPFTVFALFLNFSSTVSTLFSPRD
jgi:hypothetical protein